MTARPNHPTPLSDAQLLAYIEDELDTQASESVERALRDNPPLDRRVRAMRGDRAALHDSLGMINDERAPRDLIVSVLETVERTALLSSPSAPAPATTSTLTNKFAERSSEASEATWQSSNHGAETWNSDEFSRLPPAPLALARSKRPAVWRTVSSRPLAAAAGFALLVGGAVLVASLMTAKHTRGLLSRGDADLALSSPSVPDIAAGKSLKESVDLAIADGAAKPERDSSEPQFPALVSVASSTTSPTQSPTGESSTSTTSANRFAKVETAQSEDAPSTSISTPAITIERAAQLAAENRLAIRVLPRAKSDPAKLSAGLAALTKRDASRVWKLNSKLAPEYASSVLAQLDAKAQNTNTAHASANRDRPRRDNSRDPTPDIERTLGSLSDTSSLANSNAGAGALSPQASTPRSTPFAASTDHAIRAPAEVYHAEIAANAASLASLRSALDRAGNVEIVYEELAAPVTLAPALIEQNILWWTQPASAWVRRATVPIVVEPAS